MEIAGIIVAILGVIASIIFGVLSLRKDKGKSIDHQPTTPANRPQVTKSNEIANNEATIEKQLNIDNRGGQINTTSLVEQSEQAQPKPDNVESPRPETKPEPQPQPLNFYVPFMRNSQLTGYEVWIKKIQDAFKSNQTAVVSQGAMVSGQGGIGKTSMAVKYAYEFSGEYPGGVYWLNMEGGVVAAIQGWVKAKVKGFDLTLEKLTEMNEEAVITAIVEYINPKPLALVILDNLEMDDIPRGMIFTNAHMLVTTRRQTLTNLSRVNMDIPDDAGAFEMFLAYGQIEAATLNDETKTMVQSICRAVDNLPIALEFFGSLARTVPLSSVEKKSKEEGTLASALDLARYEFNEQHTLDCMYAAGYLSPENIDAELIAQILKLDIETIEASLKKLAENSILKLAGNTYAIHRLTQDASRLLDNNSKIGKMASRYMSDRANEAEKTGSYIENMHLIPHMLHIATLIKDEAGYDDFPGVEIMGDFADYLYYTGSYSQSEGLVKSCVTRAIKTKGEESEEHAKYLYYLAVVIRMQSRLKEAKGYCKQAMKINEKIIGKEHADYAKCLDILAGVLEDQGEYKEAEGYFRQAMEIDEKTIGKEHAEYAKRLNNLAVVLKRQGKYEEAEGYYRQAMEIDEKTIGKEHADYASHMNNLAGVLQDQGKYEEAEGYFRKALPIRKKTLGQNHPDYANSLWGLAGLSIKLEKFGEAKSFCEQAIEILEKSLGQDHPRTKDCKRQYEGLLSIM